MKCLVTGGAGFIGSHLTEKLVKLGHKVIVLDNLSTGKISNLNKVKSKIKFFKVDLSLSEKKISKYFKKVDWVFHLAGLADIVPSILNPNKYFDSNVKSTLNVLEASRKSKIKKFIYSASASCYGIPKNFPTKEDSKIDPKNPYALTKFIGEQMVIHWANVYKMPNISLRFFNVYGPRSQTTGAYGSVFGVFLAQKLANKPMTIVGNGQQTRDFIYISDLVNAVTKVASSKKVCEIYNVGSGTEVKIKKIAKLLKGVTTNIPKRPGETGRSLADISKMKRTFNWSPKISIAKGIKELLQQIQTWKGAPIWTPSKINKVTKVWFKYIK